MFGPLLLWVARHIETAQRGDRRMKKVNAVRWILVIVVFAILIASAFISTDQVATGKNVSEVGNYAE